MHFLAYDSAAQSFGLGLARWFFWPWLGSFLPVWSDAVWRRADWSQVASKGMLVSAPCPVSFLSRLTGLVHVVAGQSSERQETQPRPLRAPVRTGTDTPVIVQRKSQVQIRVKGVGNRLHYILDGKNCKFTSQRVWTQGVKDCGHFSIFHK